MGRTTTHWRLRQFAAFCLAAACGLATCSRPEAPVVPLPGAPAGPRFAPFTFLQAGDPQIGGWTSIEDTQARFVQLARVANRLRPAVVIIVGDLVNDGPHEQQLAAVDEALAEFRVPVRLIPGNHDDLATYRRKYGPYHYSFTVNNCEFVCLNSNRLVGRWFSSGQRAEAEEELQWLAQHLARARQENRTHIFVVMHHPPATLPATAARLDSLFRQYSVRVILAGHIHRTEQISYRGYTTFTVAGTGWAADAKGFGYRLFHVYADRVEQQYIRLDAPAPQESQSHVQTRPVTIPAGR
jgi:3',5'-cyclic AMP phosphodiesterase CpdA